jgi:hypothetical protein
MFKIVFRAGWKEIDRVCMCLIERILFLTLNVITLNSGRQTHFEQ